MQINTACWSCKINGHSAFKVESVYNVGEVILLHRKIVQIGFWLTIVSVFSTFSIPIGPVPVTLQIFAIFLMAAFLEPLESTTVTAGYLLIGFIGFPVFAGAGGPAILFGPAGGYIWGFVPAAFVSSIAWKKDSIFRLFFLGLALLSVYMPGLLWLSIFTGGLANAIRIGFLPFIWIDLLKISFAFFIAKKLRKTFKLEV